MNWMKRARRSLLCFFFSFNKKLCRWSRKLIYYTSHGRHSQSAAKFVKLQNGRLWKRKQKSMRVEVFHVRLHFPHDAHDEFAPRYNCWAPATKWNQLSAHSTASNMENIEFNSSIVRNFHSKLSLTIGDDVGQRAQQLNITIQYRYSLLSIPSIELRTSHHDDSGFVVKSVDLQHV